jgi:AcrR family transcriptional regulator
MDEVSLKPRKRPGQLRAHETVNRILDAAAHVFETSGYAGTTTNHVAAAASVSIGSLYQYYPNKDAIIVGLAERHIDSITKQFIAMINEFRSERRPIAEVVPALLGASAALTGTASSTFNFDGSKTLSPPDSPSFSLTPTWRLPT